LSKEDTIKLYEFLNGDISIKEFEQWVYQTPSLKEELQTTVYLDLLSFDYRQKGAAYFIEQKINPYINKEEYNIWRTKKLLNDILENKIEIVIAMRKLRQLYFETGEKLLPIKLALGYESELDDVPTPDEYSKWEENSLKEKLKKVELYRDDIMRDSKVFLEELMLKEQQ